MPALDWNALLSHLIDILPSILIIIAVIVLAFVFRKHLGSLYSRITRIGVLGFDLEFSDKIRDRLELAIKTYATSEDLIITEERLNGVLNHARLVYKYLPGARILWVDRVPLANANIHRFLNDLGINIDNTDSTEHALETLRWSSGAYEVIITNLRRSDGDDAGLKLIAKVHATLPNKQIILFISKPPDRDTPLGARLVTNDVDTLLHHIFDSIVLERAKKEKPPKATS